MHASDPLNNLLGCLSDMVRGRMLLSFSLAGLAQPGCETAKPNQSDASIAKDKATGDCFIQLLSV